MSKEAKSYKANKNTIISFHFFPEYDILMLSFLPSEDGGTFPGFNIGFTKDDWERFKLEVASWGVTE